MPRAWAFLVDYRKSLRGVPVGAGRGMVVFLLDNTVDDPRVGLSVLRIARSNAHVFAPPYRYSNRHHPSTVRDGRQLAAGAAAPFSAPICERRYASMNASI